MNPFEPPQGMSRRKFKILLLKRYFDTGYSMTGYLKYMVGIFGISSFNVGATMTLGVIYAVMCFVVGYFWHKYGLVQVDIEIGNRFNLFVEEVRGAINKDG